MPRKSYEEFEYDDDEYDDRHVPRKFKKEDREIEKKRKDREDYYNRDHDYDERR